MKLCWLLSSDRSGGITPVVLSLVHEENLDAMLALSKTVANEFSHVLKQSQKLSVIYNSAIVSELLVSSIPRSHDLIFL